jgi:hypothetical protein
VKAASRQGRWQALAALLALAGARAVAAAPSTASTEVEGRVTDRAGRPVPDADVVISDLAGRLRRADVTDADGRFRLRVHERGTRLVSIYTERGARVSRVTLEPIPGARLWLEAADGGAQTRVVSSAAANAALGPLPAAASGPPMARGRDLRGALLALPGTAGPAAPLDGPALLGSEPAETAVRLDGFLLNDPVDGRAPWTLPVGLFAGVTPALGLGPAGLRPSGTGEVALLSPRPERRLQAALAVSAGLAAAAGEAQGAERPSGRSGAAASLASLGVVREGGGLRGQLALAPGQGPYEADPESVSAMRGRRPLAVPWLARGEGDGGAWNVAALGVGSFERWAHGRAARIAAPRDPRSARRDFWLLGATARRGAARGPGELVLESSLLRSSRETRFQGDAPAPTTATRWSLAARVSTDGRLLGWHLLTMAAGLDRAAARRVGSEPSRQAGLSIASARASSLSPWVAFDEHYRPLAGIELELGLRLEKSQFQAHAEPEMQPAVDRSFGSGLLIAPRAQACHHLEGGSSRLCLLAGRFGAGLPLAPLLDATGAPPGSVDAPAEDAALALGELRWGPVGLSLLAYHRRTAVVIEDRFSPINGRIELHQPASARRRLQAAVASVSVQGTRTRAGAALLASRLEGNQAGFVDGGTGQLRPAATGAWDTSSWAVNASGPLPGHRPWSARVLLEHQRPLGAYQIEASLLGRWDAGRPRSALGRSPESGPGQVFLVQRGSLGETSGVGGLDLLLRLSRPLAGGRVWLALEAYNLTNHRPVVARDPLYTDAAVAAPEGARGRAALAGILDGEGNPVPARPAFDSPVAWAEPLLVWSTVGVAF